MLTELTQTAIAVLCDISAGSHPYRTAQLHIDPEYLIGILTKLETGGLVRHRDTSFADTLSSYELVRPYTSISLLDILDTLDEHAIILPVKKCINNIVQRLTAWG